MIRRPPRSTLSSSSAASDVYKRQGHFWLMMETRPYMTAKLGFAHCLEALDWKEEAIKEYSDLLELNPNDNQGVRYALASILILTGKYKAFSDLFEKFKDEKSTFWSVSYTHLRAHETRHDLVCRLLLEK